MGFGGLVSDLTLRYRAFVRKVHARCCSLGYPGNGEMGGIIDTEPRISTLSSVLKIRHWEEKMKDKNDVRFRARI